MRQNGHGVRWGDRQSGDLVFNHHLHRMGHVGILMQLDEFDYVIENAPSSSRLGYWL
jgi:hypothetical protein